MVKEKKCRNILVQAGSVRVLILLDNGDDQCDEFGPKIQILDAGSLLLWRHSALFGLGSSDTNRVTTNCERMMGKRKYSFVCTALHKTFTYMLDRTMKCV